MPPRNTDLTDSELEVLKALWDLGPSSVREVRDHLESQGRDLAYTTVLTFLTRLKTKRFVASRKTGQAYVYTPRVSRDKVTGARVHSLMQQLFDGSPAPLVLQLVRTERFTADEISELRGLLDSLDESPETGEKGAR